MTRLLELFMRYKAIMMLMLLLVIGGVAFYLGQSSASPVEDEGSPKVQQEEHISKNQADNKADKSSDEALETVNEDVFTRKTILVADDSNIIRNFVKRIFSDKYYVATAEDGEEAIRIIKANKDNDFIETILLDLNMPKVDGFAVLDYMRGNHLFRKMPVSIISGDSSKETIDKAFQYEIVDMLGKPFNEQNVKSVVEKTLIYSGKDN